MTKEVLTSKEMEEDRVAQEVVQVITNLVVLVFLISEIPEKCLKISSETLLKIFSDRPRDIMKPVADSIAIQVNSEVLDL